jgi:hypothetical protein
MLARGISSDIREAGIERYESPPLLPGHSGDFVIGLATKTLRQNRAGIVTRFGEEGNQAPRQVLVELELHCRSGSRREIQSAFLR